jgi:hypothetical protein
VLRDHCEREGTDYNAIRKTVLYTGGALATGDMDAFVADLSGLAAVGIEGVMIMPVGPDPVGIIEQVAPVVGRIAEL